MARKTTEARARKVRKAIEGVLNWLGFLQQYDVTIDFIDKFEDTNLPEQPNARLDYLYPYRSLVITWRNDYVDNATSEGIEESAIHEALHVLLFGGIHPLVEKGLGDAEYQQYRNLEEQAVDLATHYLMRRRPRYGYHSSGVPNTKTTAKEPKRRKRKDYD